MKRMMTVFFSGCALIGLGIGIAVMELSSWKVSDVRTDLLETPVKTYSKEINLEMSSVNSVEINHYNTYTADTEIIYDESYKESVFIEVEYHGTAPQVYQSSWWEDDSGSIRSSLWIDVYNYNDIADIFSLLHSMFDNQTYYRYSESTHIKKITVYTAYTDKITIL